MCRIDTIFYHQCAHIALRNTRCALLLCTFPDRRTIFYNKTSICQACTRNPSNPWPMPHVAYSRRRHFLALAARQDVDTLARESCWFARVMGSRREMVVDDWGAELLWPVHLDSLGERDCEKMDCMICTSRMGTCVAENNGAYEIPVRLPCHAEHVFGRTCIWEWFRKNNTCPLCRREFAVDEVASGYHYPPEKWQENWWYSFIEGYTAEVDWEELAVLEQQAKEFSRVDGTPDSFEERILPDAPFIYTNPPAEWDNRPGLVLCLDDFWSDDFCFIDDNPNSGLDRW